MQASGQIEFPEFPEQIGTIEIEQLNLLRAKNLYELASSRLRSAIEADRKSRHARALNTFNRWKPRRDRVETAIRNVIVFNIFPIRSEFNEYMRKLGDDILYYDDYMQTYKEEWINFHVVDADFHSRDWKVSGNIQLLKDKLLNFARTAYPDLLY